MLCFSALIAGSFSLGGMAANSISPLALNGIRFIFAAVIVGGASIVMGQMSLRHFRAPWRHIVLGAMMACYFVLMFDKIIVNRFF